MAGQNRIRVVLTLILTVSVTAIFIAAAYHCLLEKRNELGRRVDEGVLMTRGEPKPVGPTAKLNRALTWNQLERTTPKALPDQDASQHMPLPHVDYPLGGMLLTRKDTVEFFNLVLELKLTAQEKKDLVAFLRV